jgi:predicted Zn-dependent peptidase
VRRLEELYGADICARHYGRGDKQIISFSADFLDNTYLPQDEPIDVMKETLSVLRDLILDPLLDNGNFSNEYVQLECRNCADAVRTMINNKQQYAIHRCMTQMCRGETIGIPILGTVEDFERIDQSTLMACYRSMLAEAQVEIFYVGSACVEEVERQSALIFGGVSRAWGGNAKAGGCVCHVDRVREIEEETSAVQGKLVLGFRTGEAESERERFAYSLLNEVYGGSPSSKLFINVREKNSLCYSCFSTTDLLKGVMLAVAGIENENKEKTVQEVLLQLDKTVRAEISGEELHCAKQSLANGYKSLYDSAEGLEVWYLRRILSGHILPPEEAAMQIMQLTAEDVAAVAAKMSLDTVYFLKGTADQEEDFSDGVEDEE